MAKQNGNKFKELVLYVSQKSEDDETFASTKLNKLVAFSDMFHFMKTGQAITDAKYMKQPRGFVATCMKPVLNELEEENGMVIRLTERYGRQYKIPTPLRQPKIDDFTAEEISTVDEVIAELKDHDGSGVSQISHLVTPNWDQLPIGAEIPISVLLYPSEYKSTPEEAAHIKQLVSDNNDWANDFQPSYATP